MPVLICRVLVVALLFNVALLTSGAANAVERISWEDLAPKFDQTKDPFFHLSDSQQDALYELVWIRKYIPADGMDEEMAADVAAARQSLEAEGLDPDGLLAQVDAFEMLIQEWNQTLVEDWNGKEVRIPGYALPLEFKDAAMTEFLLVPYFGACIHVPPPPPNQMVHVQVDQGFEGNGLFTPVWVTGRIVTRPQSLNLSLVDGSSDVSVGYGLEAVLIEPYVQQPALSD